MGTNAQMAILGAGTGMPASSFPAKRSSDSVAAAIEEHAAWPLISRLAVSLAVSIPLRGLKVRNLLSLGCGQTLESTWAVTDDVPLKTGTLQIGWGEFEVVEQKMALRLTRLT